MCQGCDTYNAFRLSLQSFAVALPLCVGCHDVQSLTLTCTVKMGVKRIVLEAAHKKSLSVWTGGSMGFSKLALHDFLRLEQQYRLVKSNGIAGRCVKLVPSLAALDEQVRLTDISFALCLAQ